MKLILKFLVVLQTVAKIVFEDKKKAFTRTPFENYDESITNIVYDGGFTTKLT